MASAKLFSLTISDGTKCIDLRVNSQTTGTQISDIIRAKFHGKTPVAIEYNNMVIPLDSIKDEYEIIGDTTCNIIFQTNTLTSDDKVLHIDPIGYIESCFPLKNGTPRQGNLAPDSKALLKLKSINHVLPGDSVVGLQEYSHLWLIFWFHNNGNYRFVSKVYPPRLNGKSVGIYSTRSPHRYNPIGLTLAKIEKVHDGNIELSGIDLIDGTPILDIKPYIPRYDSPLPSDIPTIAQWVENPTPIEKVVFEDKVEALLLEIATKMPILDSVEKLKNTIGQVVLSDPRSVYRKKKCEGEPFGFHVDMANVQCRIENNTAYIYNVEVVEDNKDVNQYKKKTRSQE